jgi:hypothetical protein
MSTFEKIIKSKELWLTDAAHMNDVSEGKWLETFLEDSTLSEEKLTTLRNYRSTFKDLYLCSFSDAEDMLSQWRGYADDGKGVSLGFKFKGRSFCRPESLEYLRNWLYGVVLIQPVNYDDKWQKKILATHIARKNDDQYGLAHWHANQTDIMLYQNLSFICKNPAFSEEKEIRLIYAPNKPGVPNKPGSSPAKRVCPVKGPLLRITSDYLATYYTLPIDDDKVELYSIMTGPKNKINKRDMKLFLERAGFPKITDENIKTSVATYR